MHVCIMGKEWGIKCMGGRHKAGKGRTWGRNDFQPSGNAVPPHSSGRNQSPVRQGRVRQARRGGGKRNRRQGKGEAVLFVTSPCGRQASHGRWGKGYQTIFGGEPLPATWGRGLGGR